MNIKEIANKTANFTVKKAVELIGITLIILSLLLISSLLSYSPEDPNFIFPENTEIKNLLGSKGSFISDILFQSMGLISFLIPVTIFFTGINIFKTKKILFLIENLFFTILYCIIGSIFFSSYFSDSFWLAINGNGGFIGNFLNNGFVVSLININKNISYYLLIIITFGIFLISVNFNLKSFLKFFKFIIYLLKSKNENKNISTENIFNESITESNDNNKLFQENLPFEKSASENKKQLKKFILPSIKFLTTPSKNEKDKKILNEKNDENFLEKILLDFGVEGKVKKISHGPVVTLNEFEPAAGVKVSKIINLSEDIARNTSSESARIATVPGSNTIGIELPNSSRENVYLSEIISHVNFLKKEIKLPIALGKNISGVPITSDLSLMPHLLIAGTTGSGKSVCIIVKV